MTTHNNVHIPKESFPSWIWYAIEFFVVLAISVLAANEFTKAVYVEEIEPVNNWIFWSIVGIIFLSWYAFIRRFLIGKKLI